MMGRKHREQASLFYEFQLDDMVPKGHLLRRIDVFVTSVLSDLHKELGAFYSNIGRPSIDPELLIRMLVVGYCYGILAGLRDPFVGKALSLLHARPERDWTIEMLGKDVGLSRSVLAERFADLVGIPPMQYLAKWRMQIASGLLNGGD